MFRKRKDTLLRKIHELTSFTGADAIMFLRYGSQVIAYNNNRGGDWPTLEVTLDPPGYRGIALYSQRPRRLRELEYCSIILISIIKSTGVQSVPASIKACPSPTTGRTNQTDQGPLPQAIYPEPTLCRTMQLLA